MHSAITRYGIALTALAAAIGLRWLLDPLLGNLVPFVTLFAATAITVWFTGSRAAITVTLVGMLVCTYFFVEPRGALGLDIPRNQVALLAFLTTSSIIIGFGTALRREQRRARVQSETLRVTLDSMSDAVITTDESGRVSFLNPTAETLTGWTRAEASGQPLGDVFRSVNEQTREPLDDSSGLPADTLLVAQDGTARPIEGSSATIHNADGRVAGRVFTFRDISARKRTEEALRDADARKDEFLATLAHELRNPLAPVRNAAEIMRLKGPPSPELKWARDVIERQVQQMARLIDDLMDIARITRNRIELRRERVDLAGILLGAVETSRPAIDAGGHQLTVELPQALVHVDADPVRLAQVFANLLNNAAKYSEPGGRIVLSAQVEADEVVIAVRDQGIGIPREMLARIFEPFTQVDSSAARARGGLGIGLTLVQRLVDMHGGHVSAYSDGPGKGSTFIVRLPVAQVSAALVNTASERAPVRAPRTARILVVDDNVDAAATLEVMLNTFGYQARAVTDGKAALAAFDEFEPQIVLLDVGMPVMSGYEVARRMRSSREDIAIVAVTGWGQPDDRHRAAEAGFSHHLVKPVDPAALAALLAQLAETCAVEPRPPSGAVIAR